VASSNGEAAEAVAVQDAAWSIKDVCDDLVLRKLGARDRAVLASVERDLGRLHQRLVDVRDKRKRGPKKPTEQPDVLEQEPEAASC